MGEEEGGGGGGRGEKGGGEGIDESAYSKDRIVIDKIYYKINFSFPK